MAVHRDASGNAMALAERYATALGCHRARLWRTTVREETEVSSASRRCCARHERHGVAAFGCWGGGLLAGDRVPQCVHQLKFLADLLHERGVAGMRRGIAAPPCSGT
jgi:ketol-acid reductoisomerase